MHSTLNHRYFGWLAVAPLVFALTANVVRAAPQSAQSRFYSSEPPQAVAAPPQTVVSLDDDATCRFDTAFAAISEQAHILIVSEGTPLYPTLTDRQLADLRRRLPSTGPVLLADAMTQVAAAYDYGVERTDAHTFLLVKHYSDPEDLPCVTYDEIVHSVRSVIQVIDSFTPATPSAIPTYKTADVLYDSLTAEQARKAQTGIRLGDLDPEQQELALTTLHYVFSGPRVQNLQQLSRSLDVLKRRSTVFQWVDAKLPDQSHTKAFGFQGAFGADYAALGVPISYPFRGIGGTSYTWLGASASAPATDTNASAHSIGKSPTTTPNPTTASDPTVPTDLDKSLAAGMLANRLPSTMTLIEATSRASLLPLALVADGDRTTDLPYGDVDEAVASKPVNVFGFAYSGDRRHFMEALANVYGLQLVVGAGERIALELPSPRQYEEPRQVPREMARLIPLPLARAFASQAEIAHRRREGEASLEVQTAAGPKTVNLSPSPGDDASYFAAVRRLIALAEPSVPEPLSRPVQVSKFGPEANRLIALTMLSEGPLEELVRLQDYAPSQAMIRPETVLLTISRDTSGKSPVFSMSIGYRSRDGAYVQNGIFGSITIPARTTISGSLLKQ